MMQNVYVVLEYYEWLAMKREGIYMPHYDEIYAPISEILLPHIKSRSMQYATAHIGKYPI